MILQRGMVNDDVKKLQGNLNILNANTPGYTKLKEDGIYGDNTANAVWNYQKANNLKPDYIAGPNTLGSISSRLSTPATTSPAASVSAPAAAPVANVPDITGLTGLRDYATGKGLDVGWSPETGATVNGNKIDTSGLKLKDGRYYGDLSQLNNLLTPFTTPGPGSDAAPAPYSNSLNDKVMALLDKYLNQPEFKYDPESDPLFQKYKDISTREGENAFQNTIGDLATLTGGRPSSWATSAASQARDEFTGKLMDVVPELEARAYARQMDTWNTIANQLKMLQGIDETNYGRYRDTVGDFQVNRDYNRRVFDSNRNYDRGVFEFDKTYNQSAEQFNKNFDYKKERDEVQDEQWLKEFNANENQRRISNARAASNESSSEDIGILLADMMDSGDPQGWLEQNGQYLGKDYSTFLKYAKDIGPNNSKLFDSATPGQRQYYDMLKSAYIDGISVGSGQPNQFKDNPLTALQQLQQEPRNKEILGPLYRVLEDQLVQKVDAYSKKKQNTGDPVVDTLAQQMMQSDNPVKFVQENSFGLTQQQINTLLSLAGKWQNALE